MEKHTAGTGVKTDIGPFAIVPMWLLDAGVGPNALRTFMVLACYANNQTGEAHPSRRTLAKRVGVSVDTVDRGLRELEQAGALVVMPRYTNDGDEGGGRQTSNSYLLRFARPGVGESAEAVSGEYADPPVGESAEPGTRPSTELDHKELEKPSASVIDPTRSRRINGRDLPWDELTQQTEYTDEIHASRVTTALKAIRRMVWEDIQATGVTIEDLQRPGAAEAYERGLAALITRRVQALRDADPGLTYGPEGVARNWRRAGRLDVDIQRIIQDVQRLGEAS